MKVMIAAAGTGGHINPGIAIANKIMEKEKNSEIVFIGTSRGLETDLVPRAGYKLITIDAYGIKRKITMENIKNLLKTQNSIRVLKKKMKEFKPDVVIGTGGYICVPAIVAARSLKIPTLLHESNAFPGISVKLFASKVNSVLVGFEDAKNRIKNPKKVVLTGTPTKIKKIDLSTTQIKDTKKSLGFNTESPIVLVVGGSQGAKSINDAMMEIIKKKNINFQIMWAAGPSQYDKIKAELKENNIDIDTIKNVKIVPYIYNMEEVMNTVDVIIARSGAMTTTEVAIVEKPAIFIPYPHATENHQEYNARVLEKIGVAKIILDNQLNSEILVNEINNIISNKKEYENIHEKCKNVVIPNVEEKIYNEIKNAIKNVE